MVGAGRPPLRFFTIFCPRSKVTSELSIISSLVSIGAVGILANPGPETACRAEALATLPLASIQRRGRSIPLLRRRPRTGSQKFAVIEAGLGHRSHFFHVGRR